MSTSSNPRRWSEVTPWSRVLVMVIARMILGVVAGLAVWSLILVPFGFKATVTSSGSMQPVIGIGDVVVARPIGPNTEVLGRVVTADNPAKPGHLLTHRVVVDHRDGTYQTKGDANADADSTPMPRGNIKGRGFLLVPWIGLPAQWADTGQAVPLALTVAGLATLGVLARDPKARPADRTGRRARRGWLALRPRTAGAAGLVVAIVAGSAVLVPAALGRSAAAYSAKKANTGNTWITERCPGSTFPFTFESNMNCWQGTDLIGGPYRDGVWPATQGNYSLRATIDLGLLSADPNVHRTWQQYDLDLSGKTTLSALVGRDNGGVQGIPATQAKVFIRYGPSNTWYAGNSVVLPAAGSTTVSLNLSGVPNAATNLKQVKEIGVQFLPNAVSLGQCSVYVDNVTVS